MAKMIQMRNVPDALHQRLKSCAAQEGLSLSEFLIREAQIVADRPTREEFRQRLAARPVLHLRLSPTQIIREERDRRSRV